MNINCSYQKLVPIAQLNAHPSNANKHSQRQIEMLAKIMSYQGWRHPIVVSNLSGFIVAGHGRLAAAKKLGWTECPVDTQDFEDKVQEVAFLFADNKIAELAEHDDELMKLTAIELNLDTNGFDLDLLGVPDLDLTTPDEARDAIEDDLPEPTKSISKLGDIYELGEHRLMCGDSTDKATVEKLMNGEKADLIHTDPPYNVNYSNQDRPKAGKVDLGRIENDKMGSIEFKEFLEKSFKNCYDLSANDASIYIWYASLETINFHAAAAAAAGWNINQQIIWKKPMLLGRGRYQWAHEPCVFGVKGSPHFTADRTKTTVWDFGGYDKSKNVHPTQKPVFIPEEAINNSSVSGAKVLDLFGGSGSTLIACEKTKRKCFMMELDPHYIDVIVSRWCKYTGKKEIKRNGEPMEWTI
jgi:DNA modification methylase